MLPTAHEIAGSADFLCADAGRDDFARRLLRAPRILLFAPPELNFLRGEEIP